LELLYSFHHVKATPAAAHPRPPGRQQDSIDSLPKTMRTKNLDLSDMVGTLPPIHEHGMVIPLLPEPVELKVSLVLTVRTEDTVSLVHDFPCKDGRFFPDLDGSDPTPLAYN